MGGWDAWNVTEDADLGMRLARLGYRADLIAPPTWEDPPETLRDWINQRSRWIKGYMQTFGVHTRQPMAAPWRMMVSLLLTVGVSILSAAAYALAGAWLMLSTALALLAGWGDGAGVADLGLVALGVVSAAVAGWVAYRRAGLAPSPTTLLLAPFYWLLLTWPAARACKQIVTDPFHWEKTPHHPSGPAAAASPKPGAHAVLPARDRPATHPDADAGLVRLRPSGQRRWAQARAIRLSARGPP